MTSIISKARRSRKQPVVQLSRHHVEIDGRPLHVTLRRSARARRVQIRINPEPCSVTLVVPAHCASGLAWEFFDTHRGWIARRLARQAPLVPLRAGAEIPFAGEPHIIVHTPNMRGVVERRDGRIHVSGEAAHLGRRLEDWLKAEARQSLRAAATTHAAAFGKRPGRITVRDPKTRWGACTTAGNLSFSWRLILAPAAILDYVAAHEAAHLVEMNHSPAFWRLVSSRIDDTEAADRWLRDEGASLHRYRHEAGMPHPDNPPPADRA
ncbi:MAG TPA: hypothetical protein DDW95_15430 [Alphaproteobacteria bacterium]|nr:hypothetical protein [Alphaproteobacteria bacterium]